MSTLEKDGAMASTEEIASTSDNAEHHDHKGRVEQVHADGTVDYVAKEIVGGDIQEMPKGYYRSPQFIGTVVATCAASICAYLGWVLPANTLLLINDDIGPSPNLSWASTIWTLGSSVGFLLFGRLSDIFGRKELVMAVNVLGLIGCIVGATAQSINQLIGANACNGLAAAGQLSFGIILGELVPNKHRGPIVTLVFLSSMPFAVFGPVIARSFILNTTGHWAGWRWSYYLGIIMEVISLTLYQFLYQPPRFDQLHEGKTRWQAFRELDFGGIILFVSGFVIFIIGLSWGGTTYPWKSSQVIATLVVGGVLIIGFGVYETYIYKGVPLMPPRLFKKIGYVAVVTCATIGAMVYYSMTIVWPAVVGTLYTSNIMEIGWQSCAVGGGVLLGQIIGGLSLSYVPKVKWQAIAAAAVGGGFISSLASISPLHHTAAITQAMIGLIFVGIIDNITFPGVTLLWEAQDIGLATGVLGSIRGMGGAVAQALYVSVLDNQVSQSLAKNVPPAAEAAGLSPKALTALFAAIPTGNFTTVPGITQKIEVAVGGAIVQSYTTGFQMVFYATIPFTILLVLAACFVPDMEKYLHYNVAKKLQGHGVNVVHPVDEERGEKA